MRTALLLGLTLLAATPVFAAPAKHTTHAKHRKTRQQAQFDATVAAGVASIRNLGAQASDSNAMVEAYSRGDSAGAAEAQARMNERECKDRNLYMQAYESASPSERMVMHERCYGSRR